MKQITLTSSEVIHNNCKKVPGNVQDLILENSVDLTTDSITSVTVERPLRDFDGKPVNDHYRIVYWKDFSVQKISEVEATEEELDEIFKGL